MAKSIAMVDAGFLEGLIRKKFPGQKMSLQMFLNNIRNIPGFPESHLVRTYYYEGLASPQDIIANEDLREKTLSKMNVLKYVSENCPNVEVREGYLRQRGDGKPEQKGVDVTLGADLALIAWQGRIDHVILITADMDFVPAIKVAKSAMVNVLLVNDGDMNPLLRQVADNWNVGLTNYISDLLKKYKDPKKTDQSMIPV